MKVGVYILNYNGKDLLDICLPSIVQAAKKSSYECRVVVADNLSTDGSKGFVEDKFPEVEFHVMSENRVLCSFNDVARSSSEDILIFLNNDLKVEPDFIDPLVSVFKEKPDAFLSVPCCKSFNGERIEVSKTIPVFKWGLLSGVPAPDGEKIKTVTYTLQGGFGAFSRQKFLELGGYDDMYLPGIIEDTDICFRAWEKGYACYYEPDSVVYHMGRASFEKAFGIKKLLAISHRNTYLFAWKHIKSHLTLIKHMFFIPVRMLYALLTLKTEIVWGFFWALKKLPEVIARRKQEKAIDYKLNMKDFFNKFYDQKWSNFYITSSNREEFDHNMEVHNYFLEKILENEPKKIIEVGSGSGTMAIFLSSKVSSIVSVDNDEKILDLARETNKGFNGNAVFKKDDAFNLSFQDNSFDLAFSQGFFEHFNDDDIRSLIREQLRVAREVIFSVPTAYYRSRDFGNERLLTRRQWRNILKEFNVEHDDYYLYTRRKKNFLLKLPMMYMAKITR